MREREQEIKKRKERERGNNASKYYGRNKNELNEDYSNFITTLDLVFNCIEKIMIRYGPS